ncbi:two-partner secretion domain-containing protein [Methyloterricola oryzae]|uniref:two-partner secretion domain-containing protein n=1 Tax=Methyloterricola oryzae TaxID=1495050 RepID=UPI0005EBD9E0|nr:filamentous hemagglutinin N-terminal domain-containing protein [Methyloterricola oryzae]
MNHRFRELAARGGLALCVIALSDPASGSGGVRTDGTVGANGNWLGKTRSLSGSDVTITQEMGSTSGRNLFHSFSEFNVSQGQTVTFTGDGALKNVISRVTGDSASDIAGTLRSTVGHADVYLINPKGVTFARSARVDVPAAFHVSTADELRLKDGSRYSAKDPGVSTLSSAVPAAFGYLGTSPANNGLIQVDGAHLEVKPGQALDVAGGEIRVKDGATLRAQAGEVRMTATRGAGEVRLERDGSGNLPLPVEALSDNNAGPVTIHDSTLSTSGDGGGRIGMSGGRIAISGSRAGSEVAANNMGKHDAPEAGGVRLQATSLRLDESRATADALGPGRAGAVEATSTGNLQVLNGSELSSSTAGTGRAGAVTARAGLDVRVGGAGKGGSRAWIRSQAGPGSTGDAGRVAVTANRDVVVQNSGLVSVRTLNRGNSGSVMVTAGRDVRVDGMSNIEFAAGISSAAGPDSTGDAGAVTVAAIRDVWVGNGGQIDSSTLGEGQAGTVIVDAGRDVTVDGQGFEFPALISSQAAGDPGSLGRGGTVTVAAGRDITVLNGGQIDSTTFSGGAAGTVTVSAGRNLLVDGYDNAGFDTGIGSQAEPGSTGNAGAVNVSAKQQVSVVRGGVISSSTAGAGAGGDVRVSGRRIAVDGGNIVAESFGTESSGQTGNIGVKAGEQLRVKNGGVISIANEAMLAEPTVLVPGNLSVRAPRVSVTGGTVNADTSGNVQAGAIQIHAPVVLALASNGTVSSSTRGTANAGLVAIDTGRLHVSHSAINARAEKESGGLIGGIRISARESFELEDKAQISIENLATPEVTFFAQPGTIEIDSPRVSLRNSGITTNSAGTTDAGSIRLNFASTLNLVGSSLTTSAKFGNGGNIVVHGGSTAHLDASHIRSSVIGKGGDGGDITLSAGNLIMETGLVEANATSGNGGDVRLDVRALMPSGSQVNGRDVTSGDYLDFARLAGAWSVGVFGANIIRAVSRTGLSGNISVTAPQLNLAGAIANLGNPSFDTAGVNSNACLSDPGSSLTVVGKGGLPPRLRDWMLY